MAFRARRKIMTIKKLCTQGVITIRKEATLKAVSELMLKNHIGSIVVVETINGKQIPAGIVTDRDIALTIGTMEKPGEIRIEQIMQSHPIVIKESDGLYETIVKMHKHGVKRLPVINGDGALCGIITADDILALMGEEISQLTKIRESQIKNEKGIKKSSETPYVII